ncbi:MAG TPA: pyruvate, water dikinase regulatory protein [Deltaproteobacteria bacterium]|nr:pyruvate, water dikinase regulatory protein [Deltaproteobacteria bacterium]
MADMTGNAATPPVYLVSGGAGASAEQVVLTVLAQFPDAKVPVIKITHIRSPEQIKDAVALAREQGGLIVHTLVNASLRECMIASAQESKIVAIDIMGDLIHAVSSMLSQEPVGRPGLYRQLNREYFERVEAIEYSMAHDDGRNPGGLIDADIVLLGVSRVGKTPLSMYLSVLGWKVANVPFIKDQPLPEEFCQVDRDRIIGLVIDPERLTIHRRIRHERIGGTQSSSYNDPGKIFEEIEASRRFFRQNGLYTMDISNKPLETSADEIIARIMKIAGRCDKDER